MKQKLTIQDIAKLANVSKATVSRVLNHKPTVDPEIRERVMKIVNERGFVPSITATVLRGGRTQLIGVLAPPLSWPFVSEIILGVAEVSDRTSYEIVLYTMSPKRKHSDVLDRILAMKLSTGLIAIMPGQLGSHLDYLSKQGVPIVTIEDQVAPICTPWIGIDNISSAYEGTRYLLSLGHRRIGHILGPANFLCTSERYNGYCMALREAGVEPDPSLIWQGDFDLSGGRSSAHQILSLPVEQRPSAIFAANDQTAFGFIDIAPQYGVRVPDDIAILGFDDMPIAAFTKPGLTTIRQPHREMGETACELLLSMVDPKNYPFKRESETFSEDRAEDNKNLRIVLPTKLVVRESCGAAQPILRQVPIQIPL
jgi:LacI family transcriptional regulator